MTRTLLLATLFFPAFLQLTGCAKKEMAFVEVGQVYTFYLERNIGSNWIRGRVLERTDDGWFRVKLEGEDRWLNGKLAYFIMEKK